MLDSAVRQRRFDTLLKFPRKIVSFVSPEVRVNIPSGTINNPKLDRPIFSGLEEQAGMAELIADFVDEALLKSHQLDKALDDEKLSGAREICLELIGSGAGFGFNAVTEAARDALTAVDTAQSNKDAQAPMRRLIGICQRLRCSNSARPSGNLWKDSA